MTLPELNNKAFVWVTAFGTLLLAVALIWMFWGNDVPVVPDEIGYLSIARYIVTGEAFNVSITPSYRFGQAILLLPATIFGTTAFDTYKIGVALSCIMMALVPVALLGIAYRLGAALSWKTVASAFLVAIFPTYFYQASVVWPETSFRLFFLISVYLVASAWATRQALLWFLATASIVWLYALHPRALGLLPVMLALLASAYGREKLTRSTALISLGVLIGGALAVNNIQEYFVAVLWSAAGGDGHQIRMLLNRLQDGDGIARLIIASLGQIWSLAASSFGLYFIGLAYGVQLVCRQIHTRPLLVFAFWSSFAVFAASVMQMVQFSRIDHVIYSRYNDGASTLFVWLGVLFIMDLKFESRKSAWAAASFLASSVILLIISPSLSVASVVTPNIPTLIWIHYIIPFQSISLLQIVAVGSFVTLAVGLFISVAPRWLATIGLITVVGAVDFAVLRSTEAAYLGRRNLIVNNLAAFEQIKGNLYWDVSAKSNDHILFDQYVGIEKPLPWSDISKIDIPDGAAAIVRGNLRKNGYTCVAKLPYGADLLVRGTGHAGCGGMDIPPVPLSRSTPLYFSALNNVRGTGWSQVEQWGRWTNDAHASLYYELSEATGGRVIEFDVQAYLGGNPSRQRVLVRINDAPAPDWIFTAEANRQIKKIEIPDGAKELKIEFDLPDARSPQQAGQSADNRLLGIGVSAVCLTEAGKTCLGK